MNAQQILIASLGVAATMALACAKEKAEPPGDNSNVAIEDAKEKQVETDSMLPESATENAQPLKRRADKPETLLDAPLERRLYSDRIEASSFLWVNYNRFQENYHPNYIMDGDPTTAWIEGAEGNGIGEWIRIQTSPVSEASMLRVRVQNGYHKTEKLFKQNARAVEIVIRTLPAGTSKKFTLADSMDWQELAMELGSERFEGLEVEIVSAAEGSKYEDLCLSDIEIYVTGRTPDNPAFEAKKLEQLTTWKRSRLDAAKIFASVAAKELPIHSGYRVRSDEKVAVVEPGGAMVSARGTLAALKTGVSGNAALFERAEAALAQDFKDWTLHSISVKNPIRIPQVDGLETQTSETLAYGWPGDAFVVPALKGKSLVHNKRISLLQVKQGDFRPKDGESCKRGKSYAMRPPGAVGPDATELLVWRCVEEEERDGVYTYLAWELYEFDEEGWLRLGIGLDRSQYFDWQKGDNGVILEGGLRLERWNKKFSRLVAKEVTK